MDSCIARMTRRAAIQEAELVGDFVWSGPWFQCQPSLLLLVPKIFNEDKGPPPINSAIYSTQSGLVVRIVVASIKNGAERASLVSRKNVTDPEIVRPVPI